ncbi:acyl-CoA-binding domain-containing protein 5-B [Engraulis encrasicolus]|uniref:acyl-CoA-binding domain-containing protein 5-B n=1 Tax=Engraulis encrasicolus TaxID=184585 RepID=UPI002FD05E75
MTSEISVHELRFDAAVRVMENLPYDGLYTPSDDMMRVLYGYYKQATAGPCDVSKPSSWDSEGRANWEAWKALGGMTKETAMKEYVENIKLILEILPVSEEVSDLLDVLDNFYEIVDDGDLSKSVEFKGRDDREFDQNLINEDMGSGDTRYNYGVDAEGDEYHYVDLTRPIIDVTEWRGASPASSVNVQNSGSSITNDIHSSLHSQKEDKLVCSQELPSEKILSHVDGLLTSDKGLTSGQSCQPQEVPDDLPCDAPEHPAPEKGAALPMIPLAKPAERRAKRPRPQGESKAADCEEKDPCAHHGPPATEKDDGTVQADQSSVQIKVPVGTSRSSETGLCCHGKGENLRSKPVAMENINRDIAVALTRLQADMQDVLQRLNSLEALSSSKTKSLAIRKEQLINETKKRTSWWPFSLSPVTMSLAIIWPLLVHWIVDFYYQRRRKHQP